METSRGDRLVKAEPVAQKTAPPVEFYPASEPPPRPFDIVWCKWPSSLPQDGGFKNRPALVRRVFRLNDAEGYMVEVCYGTSRVDKHYPGSFYIENDTLMSQLGLPQGTRFELPLTRVMPWSADHFVKRRDGSGPIIGRLTGELVDAVKRIAWEMRQDGR